jgi:hypothetical protein
MSDEQEKKPEKPKLEIKPHPLLHGRRVLLPDDDAAAKLWPTLWSLLMPVYDASGRLCREAGSVSVRLDGSVFRLGVSCPTEGLQTHTLVSHLGDVLSALEHHVNRSDCSWVPDYESTKKHKQKLKDMLSS